jgi:methionine-rich copper-binding protein CopC
MVGEALAAAIVGLVALWLVFQPLIRPSVTKSAPVEPVDPEETPKGIALTALKEIEFDRETGKLSDADYEFLKVKYTAAALEALRVENVESGKTSDDVEAIIAAKVRALRSASTVAPSDVPVRLTDSTRSCASCGPRPEPDAIFCSTCGSPLPGHAACDCCGAALLPDSRFCEACGRQVAA